MLARVGDPVASIGGAHVAIVGASGPRTLLHVGRTGGARARAGLGDVTFAGGSTASGSGIEKRVSWTRGARAGTGLRHVTRSCRGAADRAGVAGWMLASIVRAVALIGR